MADKKSTDLNPYEFHANTRHDDLPVPGNQASASSRRRSESILLMILLLMIGTIISIQIREGISIQKKYSVSKENYSAYQKQLVDLREKNTQLKSDNDQLSDQKDTLTENVLKEQGFSALAQSLADARRLAGLTSVSGEGVIVTLNDSSVTDPTDISQYSLIHSQDVQYVVDLLKASGATAMSINGERIVCTTSITCTGPTIRVNNSRYPVPFVISAICDPESTYDILQNDSYLQYRKQSSVEIDLDIQRDLTIPAFTDLTAVDSLQVELEDASTS